MYGGRWGYGNGLHHRSGVKWNFHFILECHDRLRGIFPRGLAVGVVEKINPIEGEPLWDVVVKFSENFRTIQRVYVVKNLMIEEQKNIEENIPDDEE